MNPHHNLKFRTERNTLKEPKSGVHMARGDFMARLSKLKHVALDMDGTIYKGGTLFPYTIDFLKKLRRLGVHYSFLTNNPSKSIDAYIKNLEKRGIEAEREEIYNSTLATIDFLKAKRPEIKKIFLLGTPSMIEEFERAGYISAKDDPRDVPDAVIVAFDMSLTYPRLCRASWWVKKGIPYFATNPDKICPTDQELVLPDCASICACVETATGRKPDIVFGKPDPSMLTGIIGRNNYTPEEVAMVGDRIYTDLMTAHNAGTLGVLVLTGEATLADAKAANPPIDLVVDSIEVLGNLIEETRIFKNE